MGRRELREHIFRLLFCTDFYPQDELGEQADLYMDNLAEPTEAETEYIRSKTEKVIALIPEIDEMVNAQSPNWQTGRMGTVDLTIIRLAVYEMKYDEDIPVSVAINEAIEIAKRYGSDGSPSFVNGVLAKLV